MRAAASAPTGRAVAQSRCRWRVRPPPDRCAVRRPATPRDRDSPAPRRRRSPSAACRRRRTRPGPGSAPALCGPTFSAPPGSTQAIDPPPALTSARSITGTRIGWPVPCIQRLAWPAPPTSYSAVTETSPLAITLAFAVVPPMSNEIRFGRPKLPPRQRRGDHAGGRAGLHRHGRHAQRLGDVEHAAGRAHHVQLRQPKLRDRALQPIEIGGQQRDPHRRRPRWCWRARIRGFPAAPRRTGTPAHRAAPARSAAPTRRSCASLRKENRNDTATVCRPASRIASISAGSSSSASGVTTCALGVDPFGDLEAPAARHQHRGRVLQQVVEIGARGTAQFQQVAKAARGDEAGAGALVLQQRVGHHGGGVRQQRHVGGVDARWRPAPGGCRRSPPGRNPAGVVSSLAIAMRPLASSTRATSVKVPPMSMPIRQAIRLVPCVRCSMHYCGRGAEFKLPARLCQRGAGG